MIGQRPTQHVQGGDQGLLALEDQQGMGAEGGRKLPCCMPWIAPHEWCATDTT